MEMYIYMGYGEDREVVASGLVGDVQRAPPHRARHRVQHRSRMLALEHVPVGLDDFADEERVVRHVRQVRGVRRLRERESSLLTTYWSESTLSSR